MQGGDTGKRCSIAGWQYCDNVAAHWLGAILCYSFGKENLDRCNISDEKYNVKEGDSVVFSFGEIDCRCHINKHITQEKTYQMIIDDLVDSYVKAIKINIDNCK